MRVRGRKGGTSAGTDSGKRLTPKFKRLTPQFFRVSNIRVTRGNLSLWFQKVTAEKVWRGARGY